MTEEYKGKVTLYADGHVDVYGEVDTEYATDLAKRYFDKIKNKDMDTSGIFNEKQKLMMYALSNELKLILVLIKRYYNEHNKSWPTQANIRDDLSQEKGKKIDDVYCKRKIDELEKKNFVITTGKTRGKKIILSKEFINKK